MDVKGALEAFEAIRSTVPEADRLALDAELTTRYGHIAEVAGPVAVATAAETVETPECQATTFSDTRSKPSVAEVRLAA